MKQNTWTDNYSIKCRKCGNKLPPGSAFCDKCGEPVLKEKSEDYLTKIKNDTARSVTLLKIKDMIQSRIGRRLIPIALVLLPVIMLVVFINGFKAELPLKEPSTNNIEISESKELYEMKSRVTPEIYEKIEFGMTYDEVVDLIGETGGGSFYSIDGYYAWPGEYYDKSAGEGEYRQPYIELIFGSKNTLTDISEKRVLDGREIYEAKAEGRKAMVTVNDEILSSMKERMSYREIADILGTDGVLIDSESDKSGYEMKQYEWTYIEEDDTGAYEYGLYVTFYNDEARRNTTDIWGED